MEHIARDDPAAANHFGQRLIHVSEWLTHAPKMGMALDEHAGRRIFPVASYLILYRVHSRRREDSRRREVHILRFWHSARKRLPFR